MSVVIGLPSCQHHIPRKVHGNTRSVCGASIHVESKQEFQRTIEQLVNLSHGGTHETKHTSTKVRHH